MINNIIDKKLLNHTNFEKENDLIKFGAVYFRRSNPPKADWERDYKTAEEDGLNIFRHWFSWGAINYAPGKFNWEPYDKHLDLAAKHGIKTIIGEFITDVPEWLYYEFPHARRVDMHGKVRDSEMHISCVTGGHQAMCLDNVEVSNAAGEFLKELANRYKDHPGLYGYDIWNECTLYSPNNICYCEATRKAFVKWLKKRYNDDLDLLNKKWLRLSFTDWDQIQLPKSIKPYPENFDAIRFHNDMVIHWMKWRYDIFRKYDQNNLIVAHGNSRSYKDIAPACNDDWRSGNIADIFGYTYYHGNECNPFLSADIIRSASKGKEFWRAEAVGNTDFKERSVEDDWHKSKDRMSNPLSIRLDCFISLAAGARGYLNPRWRPLQDGPLHGSFGWYGMDGSRTNRSAMASELAIWAKEEKNTFIWNTSPIKGDVAILLLEESQANCYAFNGNTDYFSLSLQGSYQAFFDSNIQCDIIKLDQICDYNIVYMPYPLAMDNRTIDILKNWVKNGGTLISEACPGYFDEYGHAFASQPSRGLNELFGCTQNDVSFAPDRWKSLDIYSDIGPIKVSINRQSYVECSKNACAETCAPICTGIFNNNEIAIIDNKYGNGKTRLIGSHPGYEYSVRPTESLKKFYASLINIAETKQLVEVPYNNGITVRLSANNDNVFVWIVNTTDHKQKVNIYFDDTRVNINSIKPYRGNATKLNSNTIIVNVDGRDASIIELL